MRTLTIAAIQTSPVTCDLDATWKRFADQVHAVKDTFSHVELVVVPELLLTTEPPLLETRADWMDEVAAPIPGPLTDRVCALAKETGLWLVPARSFRGSRTSRPARDRNSWCSTFPARAGSG